MTAWERWQRWIMSFGCPTGQAEALELSHEEIVQLEPVITYALMNTIASLRMDSLEGEPLTMMELRNYADAGEGGDSLVLWYHVPWWPKSEA